MSNAHLSLISVWNMACLLYTSVKIAGDDVTLQVFEGTEGIPTNAEVVFLGKSPTLKVSEQLAGRFFNAFGDPIDGGPDIEGQEVEIGGPSVNPVRRKQPSELIATGIAGIDLNNTLVSGQKIPFFADPDQPFNQVMANVCVSTPDTASSSACGPPHSRSPRRCWRLRGDVYKRQ